jgi:cytochrome c-type biogenesis protein
VNINPINLKIIKNIVIALTTKGKYKGSMIIKLAIAFGAGLISFLSPCVLPIIPGYISYITGKNLDEIQEDKRKVLIKTIIFSLGFSSIFISLGVAASTIGNILLFFSNELRVGAGIIIILFSLQLLGLLKFNFLNQEKRLQTKSYKNNYIFPYIVGAAFAFGWTPCIGPVLGSIIALSATEATVSKGFLLLSFYSLGLAIPFILSGYFMNQFLISKKGFSKYYGRVTKFGGAILLFTGILILTNQIQVISYYILTTFPFLTTFG